MAVNLEAIKKRVLELSGQMKTSNVQLWKPDAGEYRVRGLPWKSTPDGMPFLERRFYYLGSNPRILAPAQFGKPDPINDFSRSLFKTKKPEDRELAKKLMAKMTAYMPIVIRGQEEKGVIVWGFNPFTYQRLLGFFTDEDVGDILDIENGFDLKVVVTPSKKRFNDRQVMDITIDPARKTSKLSDDSAQAKKWLDEIPNIDDMYPLKSEAEIEQVLKVWLAGDAAEPTKGDGTSRGPGGKDELDKLVDEVTPAAAASKPAKGAASEQPRSSGGGKRQQTTARAPEVDVDATDGEATKSSLDNAFEELMQDNSDD